MHGILPDITNIVLNELGQPSHVFDADTIRGTIVARMARAGETVLALDNQTYTLTTEDLVIADDEKILAIAGVIGALSSSATAQTRHIFIESATFDPVTVRRMSQRLGVRTDSSIRFEKGTDLSLPWLIQERIHQFLEAYTTGLKKLSSFSLRTERLPTIIEVAHDIFERKIGVAVVESSIIDILTRLGFSVDHDTSAATYSILVPSWRATGDVDMAADIVEEVARHIGYDTIPSLPLPGPLSLVHVHSHDTVTMRISSFFTTKGYFDAYTYPFTFSERFSRFSDRTPAVIHNTSENRTHLRAHMAESLLELISSHYRTQDQG